MNILVTGFKPFHNWQSNPTEHLVETLMKAPPQGITLEGLILPVSYKDAPRIVLDKLFKGNFSGLLMLGLMPDPAIIKIEKLAINLGDSGLPDSKSVIMKDQVLIKGGPVSIFGNFDITRILNALETKGIPGIASLSAGAFVCNATYYQVAYEIEYRGCKLPFCFVHIPPSEAEKQTSGGIFLPMSVLMKGVKLIIENLVPSPDS